MVLNNITNTPSFTVGPIQHLHAFIINLFIHQLQHFYRVQASVCGRAQQACTVRLDNLYH